MLDSFDKGWFVLQTYSGYENKVKENLLQRAQTYNMLENILRVEIPTQTVNVEKNGKVKEVEENRFPGYVLVEMVMTDEAWCVVRNTPNVTGFVGSHGNRTVGASAIGGMLIGIIFQIFIVPVLFVVFQWLQEKFKPIEWESVDNTEVEPEIEQYTRK